MAFNTTPTPYGYNAAYGGTPGSLTLPDSQYAETGALVPNLPSLTSLAAGDIGSELSGNLSTGTENLLQDQAAGYGVSMGLPWSTGGNTLPLQNYLDNLGLTSENLTNTGEGNYLNFLTGVGGQQINPSLASGIQEQNAIDLSAPNPAMAAYQEQLNQQSGMSQAAAYQAMLLGASGLGYGGGGSIGTPMIDQPGASSADIFNPQDLIAGGGDNANYGQVITGGAATPTDATSWDELLSDISSPATGTPLLNPAGGI